MPRGRKPGSQAKALDKDNVREVQEALNKTIDNIIQEEPNNEKNGLYDMLRENIQSLLQYVESNEERVETIEKKLDEEIERFSNINENQVEIETINNINKQNIVDLESKINLIERTQDEKRSKEREQLVERIESAERNTAELSRNIRLDVNKASDQMAELSGSLNGLTERIHRSVLKALENGIFKNLKDDFENEMDRNAEMYVSQILQLQEKVKELEKENEKKEQSINNLEKKLEKAYNKINANDESFEDLEKEISNMQKHINNLDKKLEKSSEELIKNNKINSEDKSNEQQNSLPYHIRSSSRMRSVSPILETTSYKTYLDNTLSKLSKMPDIHPPTFKGNSKEKPMKYLREMRRYLEVAELDQRRMLYTLANSLGGSAVAWWDIVERNINTFEDFEERFRERFWNEAITDEIARKIDSGIYDINGRSSRVEYTTELFSLAQDIGTYSEKELIRKLANHHDADIRFAIRAQKIDNIETFLTLLSCKDTDIKREKKNQGEEKNKSFARERYLDYQGSQKESGNSYFNYKKREEPKPFRQNYQGISDNYYKRNAEKQNASTGTIKKQYSQEDQKKKLNFSGEKNKSSEINVLDLIKDFETEENASGNAK